MMKRFLVFLSVGSCAFFGGLTANLIVPRLTGSAVAQTQTPATLPASLTELGKLSNRFENVAYKLSPAVVAVEATKPAKSGKGRTSDEAGSGVIIRSDDQRTFLVLTNNHVVANAKPDQITINLADGRLLRPDHVWADPESDIAVLRLGGQTNLPAAPLGDSDRVRAGQWVLAVGSPFGLNQTVTHGIISARERGQVSLGSTIRIKDFLQTDAAINPGSSGGPLLNLDGEVIGINTAIASQNGNNSGVAFSIPVNLVKRVMRQLIERGTVSRGYLGMQLAPAFEPTDALKLGLDRATGALVETVFPDTPAAGAGLKANDVVLQVDGVPIKNENHLINLISTLQAGQHVRLQVWRERKAYNLEAVVGDWTRAQGRFRGDQ